MTTRKNYLKINDPKINNIFKWVTAAALASAVASIILIVVQILSYDTEQPGMDICSNFPGFLPLMELLFAAYFVFFTVFVTIILYVYITNKENDSIAKKKAEVDSPLIGVTKEQQAKIIEMLKSVAMPAPNKQTINQARTAKLLHALTALGVIDSNRESKHLMAWIENATGYSAGETRVFNQARNAVKEGDPEVKKFQEQITQIIEK